MTTPPMASSPIAQRGFDRAGEEGKGGGRRSLPGTSHARSQRHHAGRSHRRLNDRCRLGLDRTARHTITRACLAEFASGSTAEGVLTLAMLMAAVRAHVFEGSAAVLREAGDFLFRGTRVYFKIDAYDLALDYGSKDPADASVTTRVLTVMLAEDL